MTFQPATVAVAGASGHLGVHVVRALKRRGHRVRAITRARARLRAVEHLVDEIAEADLAYPAALTVACTGVDVVLSCAGASLALGGVRDRGSFARVDRDGNLRLLRAAEQTGVPRFVYVSLFGGRELRGTAYAAAHEAVVDALGESTLSSVVVRPTGFFYFFDDLLRTARAGRLVVLGDGSARTNPIHEADVAEACADAVAGGAGERCVGGPDVLTRREIAELAREAVGGAQRVRRVPPWTMTTAAALVRPWQPRLGALLEFGGVVSVTDAVAPIAGTRRLPDHFRERAATLG